MVCTICGAKDRHVAASCPLRPGPRWYDTAIALALTALIVFGWAKQALA